jgi:PAS domain S-box-containing protein
LIDVDGDIRVDCEIMTGSYHRSVRILNVDDDEAGRYALTRLLRHEGFVVLEAASGAEALRLVREAPDVVLLDVHLPDIDGREVCRRIKADPATADIPVVHVSATARELADRTAALRNGAEGYLFQPVEAEELIATVWAMVRLHRANDRLRQLQATTAALSRALLPEEAARVVLQSATEALGTLGGVVGLLDSAGQVLEVLATSGQPACVNESPVPLSAPLPLAAAARLGQPVWVSPEALAEQFPGLAEQAKTPGGLSLAAVPLIVDGGVLGALSLTFAGAAPFDTADQDFILSLAGECAQAMERARLYAAEQQARRAAEAAQTALAESEARFRLVWEVAADAMALSDPDGIVIAANPAYYELYGYQPEQVLGQSFAVIFPEEQRASAEAQYRQVFAAPVAPPAFESAIERSDGTVRHVETRINFIHQDGRRAAMLSSIRDVTERSQAQAELVTKSSHLELLSQVAADLLAADDVDAFVHGVYQRLASLIGLAAFFHFRAMDDQPGFIRLAAYSGVERQTADAIRVLQHGQMVCGTVAMQQTARVIDDVQQRADAMTEAIRGLGLTAYACFPLLAPSGLHGTLSFGRRTASRFTPDEVALMQSVADLVALAIGRQQREQALRMSEERFRLALRGTGITVWHQDLDLRYTWIYNPAVALQSVNLLGQTDHDVLPRAEADELTAIKRRAIRSGQTVHDQVQLVLDERLHVYELTAEPLRDQSGRIIGLTCVSVDITDLMQTQAELQRARDAAEQAMREARAAAEAAARERDRMARLQALAQGFTQTITAEQVAAVTLKEAVPALGASAAVVQVLTAADGALEVAGQAGLAGALEDFERVPVWAALPTAETMGTGQALWVESARALRERYPELAEADIPQAIAVLPLALEGQTIGALLLSFSEPRDFGPGEQAFALTLARQCAQALSRTRVYAELETRVQQRTAQLRQEVARRRHAQQQLEQVREADRTRIARELHDELGGSLTGLKMGLAQLGRALPALPAEAAEQLRALSSDVDGTVSIVRRLATDLRPAMLDDFGLIAAVEQYFGDFLQRSGLSGRIESQVEDVALPPDLATACYRIVQEALTNVARHAQASQVSVQIRVEDEALAIQVQDDGRGMKPGSTGKAGHFGLVGMRERADLISGSLDISSAPGQGTSVLLRVPLNGQARSANGA